MQIIKAPNELPKDLKKSIFLAGTIEMGDSIDWQTELTEEISKIPFFEDAIILNPRRESWDSSWEQTLENKQFVEQVEWELEAMDKASVIVVCLLEDSKSPISLMEIGIHANENKMIVVCPKEFYRSGNVYIVCKKYGIPYVETIEELIEGLKKCDNYL